MKISQSFSLNDTHTHIHTHTHTHTHTQHGKPLSIFSFYEEKKGGTQQTIHDDN